MKITPVILAGGIASWPGLLLRGRFSKPFAMCLFRPGRAQTMSERLFGNGGDGLLAMMRIERQRHLHPGQNVYVRNQGATG